MLSKQQFKNRYEARGKQSEGTGKEYSVIDSFVVREIVNFSCSNKSF